MSNEGKNLKKKAKRLRANMTDSEARLWEALRNNQLGVRFRRQQARYGRLVDFYCEELRLAVEVVDDPNYVPEEFDEGANITVLPVTTGETYHTKNLENIKKLIEELQAAGANGKPKLELVESSS